MLGLYFGNLFSQFIYKYVMILTQTMQCHNKTTSDFVFLGSSSLLASGGHSSNSRNVCLWDTLLPKTSSLIQGKQCF